MSYCCKDKFKLQEVGDSFQLLQGGSVTSVNGKVGAVVLTPEDVGALPDTYEAPVTSVNEKTGAVVLDAGDIGYDGETTYPDASVGKELGTINSALSSLQSVTEIIDTASGAIASFPDGAGLPMRSLVAQINPVQDLHGYDAPWAGGAGKNLMNLDFTNDSGTVAGMTFTHGESYITLKGTASGTSYATFNLRTPIPADLNTDYTYSLTISGTCPGGLYGIEFKNGATLVQRFRCNTTDATSKTLQISSAFDSVTFNIEGLTSGLVFDCEIKIQFEKGSSKTTWQTYSNECPITGWTGLSGSVAGKNLLPDTAVINGGYVRAGNPSSSSPIGSFVSSSQWSCTNFVAVKANATYTTCIPAYTSANGAGLCFYKSDETVIDAVTLATQGNANYTFTTPANCAYIRFSWNSGTDTTAVLVAGSDPSSYVPYVTPNPITVSWQTEAGTVYGGTVDVVSGVLTVEWAKKIFNGTESWWVNESRGSWFYCDNQITDSFIDNSISGFMISNLYKQESYSAAVVIVNGKFVYGLTSNVKRFVVKDTRFTTAEEFKASLATQNLEVVYKLADAQTYQLTPQQISTLLGNNTVFVDCGSVSVTYQASIKGYIDKVLGA